MPARVSVANSTMRMNVLLEAYSVRYTAAPTPSGSAMSRVNRMIYNVFRMFGRMPMVSLSTLGAVESSCPVICGRPRTKI